MVAALRVCLLLPAGSSFSVYRFSLGREHRSGPSPFGYSPRCWCPSRFIGRLNAHRLAPLLRRLEENDPGSVASSVHLPFNEWVELLSLAPQLASGGLSERHRYGAEAAYSREYLAVLTADRSLEFWTGPARSPQLVLEVPWSDVAVDRGTRRLVMHREEEAIASFTFTGDASRTPLPRGELKRRVHVASERASHAHPCGT